jgi:hypothetical protein
MNRGIFRSDHLSKTIQFFSALLNNASTRLPHVYLRFVEDDDIRTTSSQCYKSTITFQLNKDYLADP